MCIKKTPDNNKAFHWKRELNMHRTTIYAHDQNWLLFSHQRMCVISNSSSKAVRVGSSAFMAHFYAAGYTWVWDKIKYYSLLDNAPNYLVGCVIQKQYKVKDILKYSRWNVSSLFFCSDYTAAPLLKNPVAKWEPQNNDEAAREKTDQYPTRYINIFAFWERGGGKSGPFYS